MDHAPPRADVRTMLHALQQAEVAKIVRVVALVDGMPARGMADTMLAPLRDRLARLRPARPLRFARLLFHPLDGVIVPAAAWKRGSPGVPRSVIPAVAAHVRQLLGHDGETVEAMIGVHMTNDHDVIRRAGAMLWPAASACLMHAAPPEDWEAQTGLNGADFITLAQQIATVLGCAPHLAETGPDDAKLAACDAGEMLAAAGLQPAPALAALASLLMARIADPQALLLEAERRAPPPDMPAIRVAIETAFDFLLEQADSPRAMPEDLAVAELSLRKLVELVEAHGRRAAQPAGRHVRVGELAARARAQARTQFDAALSRQVLVPMRLAGDMSDTDIATVEALARDIRRFETTARRLGGRDHFEQQLRAGSEALRPSPADSQQQRADKLRVVEILAGPQVARSMMREESG
jgi:hypothetical protein